MGDVLCSKAIVRHLFRPIMSGSKNTSMLHERLPAAVLDDDTGGKSAAPCAMRTRGARAWRMWCAWRNRTPPAVHWAWRAWTRPRPSTPPPPLTAHGIRDLLASAQGTASLLYMWVLDELEVVVEPAGAAGANDAYVVVKVGRSEATHDLTARLVREIGETGGWRACSRSPLHARVACLLVGEGMAGHEKQLRAAAGFGVGCARVDREASAPELAGMLARDTTTSMDALVARSSGRLRVKDGWRLFLSATQRRCGIGPSELVVMRAATARALRAATAARGAALTLAEAQAVCAAHGAVEQELAGRRLRVRFPGQHGLVFCVLHELT